MDDLPYEYLNARIIPDAYMKPLPRNMTEMYVSKGTQETNFRLVLRSDEVKLFMKT